MLYERYTVELGEMQVLVGRVKDSWKYAQLKGTSTLHVLDRFNISMQVIPKRSIQESFVERVDTHLWELALV